MQRIDGGADDKRGHRAAGDGDGRHEQHGQDQPVGGVSIPAAARQTSDAEHEQDPGRDSHGQSQPAMERHASQDEAAKQVASAPAVLPIGGRATIGGSARSPRGDPILKRLYALPAFLVLAAACQAAPQVSPQVSPTGTASPPATTEPTPAATASPSPGEPTLAAWERLPDQPTFESSLVFDMIEWFDSLIAVGCVTSVEEGSRQCQRPAVWTSRDGRAWEGPPELPDAAHGQMRAVAPGGPGLIAVGSVREAPDDIHAAIWTSPNARTWTRVPDSADFAQASAEWVFVWRDRIMAGGFGAFTEAAGVKIWASDDGQAWTPRPADFGSVLGRGAIPLRDRLVLWGPSDNICPTCKQTVWISQDGETWSPAPDQRGLDDASFATIIEHGGRLLAAGSIGSESGNTQAAMWTSPDGLTWTPLDSVEGPPGSEISHLVVSDAGLVAAGTYRDGQGFRPIVWVSSTGDEWLLEPDLPDFPGGRFLALQARDEGVYAFLAADQEESGIQLWFRPIVGG
jgi:hypothetical protein